MISRIITTIFDFVQKYFNKKNSNILLYDNLKRLYIEKGWEWQEVNIGGIRNNINPKQDEFNDYIFLTSNETIKLYRATTDPGVYYTKGGSKKKFGVSGAAHMCYGLHKRVYGIGIHQRSYQALVQKGKLQIWRDANEDFKNNDGIIENGIFGINVHHANDSKKVGKYSAGCQVIQSKIEFEEFLEGCRKYCLSGKKEKLLNYALIDKRELGEVQWKKLNRGANLIYKKKTNNWILAE